MIYNKINKGKLKKLEFKTNCLKFGIIGLKAANSGILNFKQIEAAWQTITRSMKKKGKLWLRVFPNLPISSKPTSSWMGKKKGEITHLGVWISSGMILFELCGINLNISYTSLKAGGNKLPIKTIIFT